MRPSTVRQLVKTLYLLIAFITVLLVMYCTAVLPNVPSDITAFLRNPSPTGAFNLSMKIATPTLAILTIAWVAHLIKKIKVSSQLTVPNNKTD